MQIEKGLHEKMCQDIYWILLLSGSSQRVLELAEAWVVCIWKEGKKKGKVMEKEEREYNTELSFAFYWCLTTEV